MLAPNVVGEARASKAAIRHAKAAIRCAGGSARPLPAGGHVPWSGERRVRGGNDGQLRSPLNLIAGEALTSQAKAQGVEFGTAEQFKQPPPAAGNCGGPIINEDAAFALSPPRYVLLEKCGAAAIYRGTYGTLLNSPRGSLSVEVRDQSPGPKLPARSVVDGLRRERERDS
jgi:hypothetical protein